MRRLAQSLLERIAVLVERGRNVRARILDAASLRRVDADLLAEVHALLDDTLRLLDEAERGFSPDGTDGEETRWTVVADLAWLSQGEVRACRASLTASERAARAWKVVGEGDSALERAERAVLALEGALREALGLPPSARSRQRLRESLEVRRLYAALRRAILQAGEPRGEALATELWALSRQLDALQNAETYGVVRIEDRRQIQSLANRIDSALGDPSSARESERRRIWQDLDSFSSLLMSIHQRDELRAHDLELVRSARERLRQEPADPHPRAVLAELSDLLGRDDELDSLLVQPEANPDPKALDATLGHLEVDLHHRTGGGAKRGSAGSW